MSRINDEDLESLDDANIDTLIARLKRKPRMAMEKMQEEFSSELNDCSGSISRLERDNIYIKDQLKSFRDKIESLTPKPPKIDTSKVPNEWEANRAFNKRWPWIEIDKRTNEIKCHRCRISEYCEGFSSLLSDNTQWFIITHGNCQDPNKKVTP